MRESKKGKEKKEKRFSFEIYDTVYCASSRILLHAISYAQIVLSWSSHTRRNFSLIFLLFRFSRRVVSWINSSVLTRLNIFEWFAKCLLLVRATGEQSRIFSSFFFFWTEPFETKLKIISFFVVVNSMKHNLLRANIEHVTDSSKVNIFNKPTIAHTNGC